MAFGDASRSATTRTATTANISGEYSPLMKLAVPNERPYRAVSLSGFRHAALVDTDRC
jgi:hypothetical protein